MTIPTTGAVSFGDIASEYGLKQNNLSLRRLSSISGIVNIQVDSFRGKNYWDKVGSSTPTNTFSGTASAGTNISGTQAVIRSVLDMDDTTSNIIYETGGGGRGVCVYGYTGSVYAQAGAGSVAGGSTEVSFPIPADWTDADSREIIVCLDVTGTYSTLWLDGIRRSIDVSSSAASVAGSDIGGTGRAYNGVCATRAFAANPGDGTYVLTNATQYGTQVWNGVYMSRDSWPVGLYGVTIDGPDEGTPLRNQPAGTIRSMVTIDNQKQGVIYECGGTTRGGAIYVYGGKIYAQAGNGGAVGGSVEVSWNIPDSITTNEVTSIIFTVNTRYTGSSSAAELYVNNELVASNYSGAYWTSISGTNEGGTGKVYGEICANRMTGSTTYNGTIYETLIWNTSTL